MSAQVYYRGVEGCSLHVSIQSNRLLSVDKQQLCLPPVWHGLGGIRMRCHEQNKDLFYHCNKRVIGLAGVKYSHPKYEGPPQDLYKNYCLHSPTQTKLRCLMLLVNTIDGAYAYSDG